MASKFGLAGGIPERRVRPIWDAVDSRQYKAALKLCTGLLAKHPTSPYVLLDLILVCIEVLWDAVILKMFKNFGTS
nr:unnamed protein product [Digitaria exilis]